MAERKIEQQPTNHVIDMTDQALGLLAQVVNIPDQLIRDTIDMTNIPAIESFNEMFKGNQDDLDVGKELCQKLGAQDLQIPVPVLGDPYICADTKIIQESLKPENIQAVVKAGIVCGANCPFS